MKTQAMFRVDGVRPDGGPVLILRQSTLRGAELVKRLVQNVAPYAELRIEYGPNSEMADGEKSAVDELSR
jgi:hypothetical protein